MNLLRKKIEARLFAGDVKRMIRQGKIPDQRKSLERLKQHGCNPNVIYDVGAYEGEFTQRCLEMWPDSHIVAFEALPQKIGFLKSRFEGKNVKVVEGIVGEADLDHSHFFADENASSVLESQEFTPKKKIIQKMITLDKFVNDQRLPSPQLLKIDTQGYEYLVLKGFDSHLSSVEIILAELNFIEVYYGAHLAHEVIAYLFTHGFVVYDICEITRRPLDNALMQIDFIFIKADSHLRKDKRWDDEMKKGN